MTYVVSIRVDDDVARAVKALGRGSAASYLRTLLLRLPGAPHRWG